MNDPAALQPSAPTPRPSLSSRAPLPIPAPGPEAAVDWIEVHLSGLSGDDAAPSPRFRGGQQAADAALEAFDVRGYAARRNEVWPPDRRGASALSPWIRHGLLPLPRVWAHVGGGPSRDVAKFRDELLWQEYARHLYARLGTRTGEALRFDVASLGEPGEESPWPDRMLCMASLREELETDGWLVNQTRMWLASQWTVRSGADWREGEDHFFRHLLDGSRAANRLGWQWTVGAATGKPYGFSRWQVDKRAPGWCRDCALRSQCPIQGWPPKDDVERIDERPRELGRVEGFETGAGPTAAEAAGEADVVWLTAESLGDEDPALAAMPDRPAIFVFDAPRLARWRLSRKRLAFLVETLADLAQRRPLELAVGDPAEVLAGRPLAATWTPVPGWRDLSQRLNVVEVHPWPWLRRPHTRSIGSFSAWRKGLGRS